MWLQEDNTAINKESMGYLFGLQGQVVNFVRVKMNFITDLLASLLLKFPKNLPDKVSVNFTQNCASTLSYTYSFERKDGKAIDSSQSEDWMKMVMSATDDLCLDTVFSDDMDVEGAISSMARSSSSITNAKSLLEKMIKQICTDVEKSLNLVANLLDKSSTATLQFLCLILSYGEKTVGIKRSMADKLSRKDLKGNMIIVTEKDGSVFAYSLLKTGASNVWKLLQTLLESSDPKGFVSRAFSSLIIQGDVALKADTKKKKNKRAPDDYEKLKCQIGVLGKKVCG